MDLDVLYRSGAPHQRHNAATMLNVIADDVLKNGDVEKALQRAFRFGTEEDMGLLDLLDRLREEIQEIERTLRQPNQHEDELPTKKSESALEDAESMREALRQVESLDDLKGLDPELMQRSLSSDEMEWVEKWADMTGMLVESGLVAREGNRMVLTPVAIRRIGDNMLRHIYLPPLRRGRGSHDLHRSGERHIANEQTSRWQWGKPFDIDVSRTLTNSIRRSHNLDRIRLTPEDFEVFDRESTASVATILLIDMSRSMFESGAWDAAKRSAIALDSLIFSSRPLDQLKMVGFSGDARRLELADLPSLSWDQFSHGTNLHAGLVLSSRMLKRQRGGNRQIVIVTDGEPTAFMDGAMPVFEHPVTERTLQATLREGRRASRTGIAITTVFIDTPGASTSFAETFSHAAAGRLIVTPASELGAFIVRDIATGRNQHVGSVSF